MSSMRCRSKPGPQGEPGLPGKNGMDGKDGKQVCQLFVYHYIFI